MTGLHEVLRQETHGKHCGTGTQFNRCDKFVANTLRPSCMHSVYTNSLAIF